MSDMYTLGTLGHVLQVLTLPSGTLKALVEGKQRIKVVRYIDNEEYCQAVGSVLEDKTVESEDFEALKRTLLKKFEQYIKINWKNSSEILSVLSQIPNPSQLADAVATHVHLKVDLKQSILEELSAVQRTELIINCITREIEVSQTEK